MFSDMFGNPVVNPKGWEECRFADVIDRLEGGKNVAPSESPSDHRILKVSAVTYGEYRPEEAKWLPANFIPPDSYIVRSGDLLISRANTVDLIGATAYVWDTPARMVLPDKIWRFVWRDRAPIDSLYVFHMTRHKDFQRMIGSRASGTSGSMKNISKPKLLGLTIPLPPLPMQQEFAERVRRIRAQRAILVKQLFELDSLFSSLQSQAFNGRLSTSVLSDPLSA
jgi:type I restriction enzyme S subunit